MALAKGPVKLKKRAISGGRYSLYIEITDAGKRHQEYLGMYLQDGNDHASKIANKGIMEAAEMTAAKRLVEIQSGRAGIVRRSAKALMIDVIDRFIEVKKQAGLSAGYIESLTGTRSHWIDYAGTGIKVSEITRETLRGFIDYLRTTACRRGPASQRGLAPSSVKLNFAVFDMFLVYAQREGIISVNPTCTLDRAAWPKAGGSMRAYLSMEELSRLAAAPCRNETVKQMFLFACFTGLRYSDVLRVQWYMIEQGTVRMLQHKTKNEVQVPLSANALRWIPKQGMHAASDYVFADVLCKPQMGIVLQDWTKAAGIPKHITFHCSRHTFATLTLTYGADIYTVSKLLGHTAVATTQIYAKIIDKKKQDAVSGIPLI